MRVAPTRILAVALVLLSSSALASAASADAANVTPTPGFFADDFANNASCSLREAIEVANENAVGSPEDSCVVSGTLGDDTVRLSDGTYVLDVVGAENAAGTNAANDLELGAPGGDNLSLVGSGPGTTTIDTDDSPVWQDRVLEAIHPGLTEVIDLTVTGGNDTVALGAEGGGGIRLGGSALLRLSRARVTANATTGKGGGVASAAANLVITESEVSGNSSTTLQGDGGGLFVDGTSATLNDSAVTGNVVSKVNPRGGGIRGTSGSVLDISRTIIAGNSAADPGTTGTPSGGGIDATGEAFIQRSTISENEVSGGLAVSGSANAQQGGGISFGGSQFELLNSTVSDNHADGTGGHAGGLRVDGGTATIISSTFAGNTISPGEPASAIYVGTGAANVRGSIVAAAGSGPACNGVTSQNNNIFSDASCAPGILNDEINADPQLGPLADEGGRPAGPPGFEQPLLTRSPGLASTAVDHVPTSACTRGSTVLLTSDERDFPRPVDGDGDATADCDAGATEALPCHGQAANRAGTSGGDTIAGTGGDDAIAGLGGNDEISGLGGNDRICGGDGNDTMSGGPGDDELDGGANTAPLAGGDFASFAESPEAITASLAAGTAAGEGNDTFAAGTIEHLLGSPQDDVLTGDGGPNLIGGLAGDDALNGLAGDDGIDGQSGSADRVLFAGAPGPVTATFQDNPAQGSATGFGTDILFDLEAISGSSFGDTLTGDSGDDALAGLGGADTLAGLGGDDDFAAQDGVSDTVDCAGGGADTGTFDLAPAETFLGCADGDGDAVPDMADACTAQAGTLASGCVAPAATPPDPKPRIKKCKKGTKPKKVKGKRKCVKKKKKKKRGK